MTDISHFYERNHLKRFSEPSMLITSKMTIDMSRANKKLYNLLSLR